MTHLELVEVSKHYGAIIAVDRVSLTINQGERLALLGPSGCGKTTTLNTIAGFLMPDAGRIFVGGRDVMGVPAHKRNMGMVFQSYALFPHLSVFENVAFGLRMRGVRKSDIASRVGDALGLVRLAGLGDRYPRQLSGGQQQRVALARALVIRPEILLLDEPLSNLDAKLRQEMRTELVEILHAVGITTIFVTHDQAEALALSDRLAIMNGGRVEQVGLPSQVYEEPASAFVAKFLGEANVLPGAVCATGAEGLVCDIGSGRLVRSERKTGLACGDRVEVIVRVERLQLSRRPSGLANSFPGQLEHVMYLGSEIRYAVRLDNHRLVAVDKNRGGENALSAGEPVYIEWSAWDCLVAASLS